MDYAAMQCRDQVPLMLLRLSKARSYRGGRMYMVTDCFWSFAARLGVTLTFGLMSKFPFRCDYGTVASHIQVESQ
jgi:hypothetical protein